MKFVNLTPHPITIQLPGGERVTIERTPDCSVARIASRPGVLVRTPDGIPVYTATQFGEPEGVPPPTEKSFDNGGSGPETYYIVSAMFAGRMNGRTDVLMPGTGPNDGAIRNAAGQVEAVTRLISV